MIRIITIEREYGSGAAQIAAKVSAKLGWKLWAQQLTQEIAPGTRTVSRPRWRNARNAEIRFTNAC